MKSVLAVSLFLSVFLIGCGDGVPKVEDYSNVVFDGLEGQCVARQHV